MKHLILALAALALAACAGPTSSSPAAPTIPDPLTFDATSTWTSLGTGFSAGEAEETSLAIDSHGVPFVAYGDLGNGNKLSVMKRGTDGWELVGTAGFSAGEAFWISLTLRSDGVPYVAFYDNGNQYRVVVKRYTGVGDSGWEDVGASGAVSDGIAQCASLAFDRHDVPYVAYQDFSASRGISVKKFTAGSWQLVGSAGWTGPLYTEYTGAPELSLAIAPDNTPYVAFRDGPDANDVGTSMISLKKFTGNGASGWEYVGGSGGVSDGGSAGPFVSLTITRAGVPLVAFKDLTYGGKLSVSLYQDGAWSYVGGAPAVSLDETYFLSIAANAKGVPYVAYYDQGKSGKATVLKFDGTSWVAIGGTGFTPSAVAYTSLALDSYGTPYLAYQDFASSRAASVVKAVQ